MKQARAGHGWSVLADDPEARQTSDAIQHFHVVAVEGNAMKLLLRGIRQRGQQAGGR